MHYHLHYQYNLLIKILIALIEFELYCKQYSGNNHSLNLKELEPTKKSIRARLSKYGERTGKIFETVLFELDNSEDIVNHILKEEKGRNMLLSNEMKFIGIYCDLIDTNLLCTIIDIVQDFSPFKENKENNNTSNIKNNINNIKTKLFL